jgi:ribosomal protein S12 methylthiotransferase
VPAEAGAPGPVQAFVGLQSLEEGGRAGTGPRPRRRPRRPGAPRRSGPRVALVSLGCAKNQVDAEIMLGLLEEAGFRLTGEPRRADLVIVNTCAFIDEAKQESIETILSVADGRPVIVAGCLAQRYPDELLREMPEIAAVVGTGDFERIVEVARRVLSGERVRAVGHAAARYERLLPRRRLEDGPFAYVKIAEGCDHDCAFCAIPSFRGRFRSRPAAVVAEECRLLAAAGVRELILVSQDTTYWGRDLRPSGGEEPRHLGELLRAVWQAAAPAGARWLRCLYLYPYLLDDRILEAWAEVPGALPYFDIPLQHGSDAVLAAMRRPDRRRSIVALCERLRRRFPEAVLRSSFIVGYPGETEAHFRELLDLLREVGFDHAGFFVYSAEDGTPAAALPDQVPEEVRHERYHRAMEVQAEVSAQRNAARVGRVLEVLIEREVPGSPGYYEGRWWGQAPDVDGACVVRATGLEAGQVVPVRIEGVDGFDLYGAPDG